MISGVYIKVGKRNVDVLELTDEQFVSLLSNELKAFSFKVPTELYSRVLRTYLIASNKNRDKARITALLALEQMGRRYLKNLKEWENCLRQLNIPIRDQRDSPDDQ